MGCDHLGIVTARPRLLERFYCGRLGFSKTHEEVLPRSLARPLLGIAADCLMVKLTRTPPPDAPAGTPAFAIELFRPLSPKAAPRHRRERGYHHFGLRVGDREAFSRALVAAGVPVVTAQRDGRTVYFTRDPDGNRIELRA